MIVSFRNDETKKIFEGFRSRRFGSVARAANRKLQIIDFAKSISDLRNPRGNRLEILAGNRAGQFSIRINDQYRVCFRFEGEHAHDVEIVDYH